MSHHIIFNRVIIIGLGLMGGSLAKAIRKSGCFHIIAAYDSDPKQLNFAVNHNIIDQTYKLGSKILEDDLIIIAAPLSGYEDIAKNITKVLNKNTIIADIGSLKFFVEKEIMPIFGKNAKNFVSCHPIAGSEKSGIRNSDGELFIGKKVIIIKASKTSHNALEKLSLLWTEIGSQIQFLTAKKHDRVFALISHLPQFLSFINQIEFEDDSQIMPRHLRLQNSNGKIWLDIFKMNQNNLNHYLKFYLKNCKRIQDWLALEQYEEILLFMEEIFNLTCKFGFIYEEFPKKNQRLILERILITSCFVSLPDISDFRIYSGSGFRDFIIILSYLKYFLKDKKQAISLLKNSRQYLIKSLSDIKSKINNYEFN